MKRTSVVIIAGLALAVSAAGISPALAQPVTSLKPASLAPVLGQSQSADDKATAGRLPARVTGSLDLSSLRVLGRDSDGTYSIALDTTGQDICVVAQMASKVGSVDTACLSKVDLAQKTISLGIGENNGGSTVSTTAIYLFPSDVDLAPLKVATLNHGAGVHTIVQHGIDELPQRVELGRGDSAVKFSFVKPQLLQP